MIRLVIQYLLLACLFLPTVGCQEESKSNTKESHEITQEDLIGEWKVVRATGRLEKSSTDAIFTFNEDGVMTTNKIQLLEGNYTIADGLLSWQIADAVISYEMKLEDGILFLYPTSVEEELELHRQ